MPLCHLFSYKEWGSLNSGTVSSLLWDTSQCLWRPVGSSETLTEASITIPLVYKLILMATDCGILNFLLRLPAVIHRSLSYLDKKGSLLALCQISSQKNIRPVLHSLDSTTLWAPATILYINGSLYLGFQEAQFDPCVGKILWRRKWQPTLVLLPGKFHGWRSMVGYSPWGLRVRHDWATSFSFSLWNWKGHSNFHLPSLIILCVFIVYFPLLKYSLQ